ncbi:anthranilate synthase component I family protein [Moraxella sp. ZJ142]|uniref:anthranilate synthase component I family protein n=1 Tax=Moraxella marmotae TaxID=3344520 RepID=UPI0035D5296F
MPTTLIPSTLTTSELTALISHHYPAWQVCFLNNQHSPIIGILPKISWQLNACQADDCPVNTTTYTVSTAVRCDDLNYQSTTTACDYAAFLAGLIDYCQNLSDTPTAQQSDPNAQYHHGLMGFVGYDAAAHALNPCIAVSDEQPASFFGHYDVYLVPADGGFWLNTADSTAQIWADKTALVDKLTQLSKQHLPQADALKLKPVWSKAEYQHAFDRSQDYLYAGDGYQINLTQPWRADTPYLGVLTAHLPSLMATSNAPFGGFLRLPTFELLSVSPELFFTFYQQDGHKHIITKPIKGTRPRAKDASADNRLKNELKNSEKDIAENLMIVDLLRNDLGKYAITGGVKTPTRFAIESFYNVHHMVSTITAQLRPDCHPLAVLFGSLPAGSITGAPKKRACEMIDEIESMPRGAYCGTMGFLNFDGTGQFNVLIRTVQANAHTTSVWAGGGITVRSKAQDEYQECLDKIQPLLDQLS